MAKYQAGQTIRVVSNLAELPNKAPRIVPEMHRYAGYEYEIGSVIKRNRDETWYCLSGAGYTWHEDWLELPNDLNTAQEV